MNIAVAMVVMVAVLTVLIAPSIDMPETLLLEHHVASHLMVNTASGTLVVVGTMGGAHAFHIEDVHVLEISESSVYALSQTSLVLRC